MKAILHLEKTQTQGVVRGKNLLVPRFLFTFSFFRASEYVRGAFADSPSESGGAVPLRLAAKLEYTPLDGPGLGAKVAAQRAVLPARSNLL